jgi:hypothetical protein
MELQQLQTELKALGLYTGDLDGKYGKLTAKAIDLAVLGATNKLHPEWSEERRRLAAEQLVYREHTIDVGAIDGLMGEQTRYAARVYNARITTGSGVSETQWRDRRDADDDVKPKPADTKPIPFQRAKWPTEANARAFYGDTGAHQVLLDLPFPMRLDWEPGTQIHRVSCHEKVATPLRRIWQLTLDHYGYEKVVALRLDRFGGCLYVRPMRGSTRPSMHSWGIAWDVDPSRNQLKWGRDRAALDDLEYDAFWSFVEAEGATSLGRARNYDWMHFQFANRG